MAGRKKISEEQWLKQIFDAESAKKGGLVRRKISSVEKYSSEEALLKAVKSREFHMIKTDDQYLVFCNSGKFNLM